MAEGELELMSFEEGVTLKPLLPKHKRFVEEYLVDLNATQAAIRAGYSPVSAKQTASDIMTNTNVRAYIDIALAERSKRVGINADVVVRELARIALANPARVVAQDGSILEIASEDDLAAIQSIKVKITPTKNGEQIEREVKFNDKNKSLELLGKHLGMFIEKHEHKVSPGQFDVSQMSDEELMKELERQKRIAEQTIDVTPF